MNIDNKQRKSFLLKYSGHLSERFWQAIEDAVPLSKKRNELYRLKRKLHDELYLLGCELQSLEQTVIKKLNEHR